MYSAGFNRYFEFASGVSLQSLESQLPLLEVREPISQVTRVSSHEIPRRDRLKILQVEKASNYHCQIQNTHFSFISESTGNPYLEGHHIIPLSQQDDFSYSLDCFANIIALCPNCHRFLHYGLKSNKREQLIRLYEDRAERFDHAGILVTRAEFLDRLI